jgi:hypothetical protein
MKPPQLPGELAILILGFAVPILLLCLVSLCLAFIG